VHEELEALPAPAQPIAKSKQGTIQQLAASLRRLPEVELKTESAPTRMQLARASADELPAYALVLDYVILNSSQSNYTFQADTTYFVNGWVYLNGTTAFEAGAVIKFATNSIAGLYLTGPVVCQATPVRPVVCTSMNDDSIGERIAGSTGAPLRHPINQSWITADAPEAGLENMRFSYAGTGIWGFATQLRISNCQFIDCGFGVTQDEGQRLNLVNCLFARCNAPIGSSGEEVTGDMITVNQCAALIDSAAAHIRLTNCVFANLTNLYLSPPLSLTGSHNGFYNSPVFGINTVVTTNHPFNQVSLNNPYLDTKHFLATTAFYDKGARTANQAGLYHYTTRADQVREASSTLDIGFHYLAVNADGTPFDSDGDGTPDYIEDRNGNGVADAGEPDANKYVVILHPIDTDLPESQRRRVVQQYPGGPNRWLATFTPGARTVLMAGPARTNFQEVHLGTTYWVYLNSTNNPGGTDLRNTNLPGIWVRTLPEPFDGTVPTYWLDAALAANNAGVDDVLAVAWQYISGAQPSPTWENYGKQDRGDARYGPLKDLNCTGPCERYPGGDFNDYLGIAVYWPAPDNFTAYPKFNPSCSNNFDCATNNYAFSLDCSGYIRMVFGYRRNMEGWGFVDRVPLCYGTNAVGLPRRADWQFNFGPGVVIIPHTPDTVPTNFAKLQVGDLVFFEYPNTATYDYDADYEIDHVGIYLGPGRRTGGATYHYFISSRAKLNGPTIGSAASGWGGQSILDGNPATFYWVGAYRCVRRL
ncbi:MAG: C40 family peptidase, partial [Verrucomicrobiae bacterium]|nr:C40 family peptidase [Verrucomicrobiae bacterium]